MKTTSEDGYYPISPFDINVERLYDGKDYCLSD